MNNYEIILPLRNVDDLNVLLEFPVNAFYAGLMGWSRGVRKDELSLDEIKVAFSEIKEKGKNFYISLNTIPTPFELEIAFRMLEALKSIGVDAIICNDLCIVKRAVELNLEVHVSLGSVLLNLEDLFFWKELGVKRFVVSPHLDVEEIEGMVKSLGEIEVMVYGAKCVFTYTGICRMSSYFDIVMKTTSNRFMIWEGSSKRSGVCFKPCAQAWQCANRFLSIEPMYYMCYNVLQLKRVGVRYYKIGGRGLPPNRLRRVVEDLKSILEGEVEGVLSFNSC